MSQSPTAGDYAKLLANISNLLAAARTQTARSINSMMTATYWTIGYYIIEFEQAGQQRADYGQAVLEQLSADLSKKYQRGFSVRNLRNMRAFYTAYKDVPIRQTLSAEFHPVDIQNKFPLPWSSYVRLLSLEDENARRFYEQEALRNGWSTRQLDRQITSQFYTRTLLSKNKSAMLEKDREVGDVAFYSAEQEIKDPYLLEFLDLKDEYSESELEQALIERLEEFLMELGGDFTFVGRQRRLRIDDEWYRVDLVFFHRRLRCLVLIDLKLGKFSHSDAGQMHMYLNYAREHWTYPGENPPVGLILCAQKGEAIARYSLEGLANQVLAAEYKTKLPDEQLLVDELKKQQRLIADKPGPDSSYAE